MELGIREADSGRELGGCIELPGADVWRLYAFKALLQRWVRGSGNKGAVEVQRVLQ